MGRPPSVSGVWRIRIDGVPSNALDMTWGCMSSTCFAISAPRRSMREEGGTIIRHLTHATPGKPPAPAPEWTRHGRPYGSISLDLTKSLGTVPSTSTVGGFAQLTQKLVGCPSRMSLFPAVVPSRTLVAVSRSLAKRNKTKKAKKAIPTAPLLPLLPWEFYFSPSLLSLSRLDSPAPSRSTHTTASARYHGAIHQPGSPIPFAPKNKPRGAS